MENTTTINDELLFSQVMISQLAEVSTATIAQTVGKLGLINIPTSSAKHKKYNISDTRKLIEKAHPKIQNIHKKTQVFYNFKGGTGKTSVCYQVAFHLTIMGYNVLVIDCDPQAHMSTVLRIEDSLNYLTLYDVLIGGMPISEAIIPVVEGLDIVPSNISLTRVEVPLSQKAKREERLREAISLVKNKYDYILIDTNPNISILNLNALIAADMINFVCETAPFSLSGMRILIEETQSFFSDMKLPLNFKIIANKYESKTATSQEVLGSLRADYKDRVINVVIRKCEDINLSSKYKLPVAAFAKRTSPAIEDILDLLREIVDLSSDIHSKNKIYLPS